MGINLGTYYPGGVALQTTYYCYHCHSKMERNAKDKSMLTCKSCKMTYKDENPAQDDELIDYQKFNDKF